MLAALEQGAIKRGDVVIIRYEGPKGGPGMPEMLTPTSALVGAGLGALVDPLVEVLSQVPDDPFQAQLVAVPGEGVRSWLTWQLSQRLGGHRGVVAHVDWVFPSTVRDGHVGYDYLYKRVKAALGGRYTPHQLRHRFATQAYRGTHDLRAVQELLGHSSPTTTVRYTLIGNDAMTAAVHAVA